METGIQPTFNLAERGDYGFGGGSGIWLFAILALFLFGNGGLWGNRGAGNCATVEDVNQTANFSRLEGQVMNNGTAINQGFTNIANGLCDLGYKTQADFANVEKAVLESKYSSAQNTASIIANTTAQTQKILDAICQNKIECLQEKVNGLQLQNALCGVVRYPNSMTYTAGQSPFCNNACCGCNY